jgi:hypothetical protein
MTSVPFELNVTIQVERQNRIHKETYERVEFRFGTKEAYALEEAAGSGIQWLIAQGRSVKALVLLVCYGLRQTYPKMTEQKAIDIIDAFRENGGNVKLLSEAASKALHESGVYGREEMDQASEETDADPLAPEIPATSSVTG